MSTRGGVRGGTSLGGGCIAPPNPDPATRLYIYTRISRAFRARSILLDLDLEATSAPQSWTLLLVGRGGELGLTIQADNAG